MSAGQAIWVEGRLVVITPPRTPRIRGRQWQRIKQLILERDGYRCWLCGHYGADSCDHIIGLADGGTNDFENLAAAHLRCNLGRAARRTNLIRRQRRRPMPRVD